MAKARVRQEDFVGGVLRLLGWFFGIIFLVSGIFSIVSNTIDALCLILLGLIIFPPFWRFAERTWHFKLNWKYKLVLFIILTILFGAFGSGK